MDSTFVYGLELLVLEETGGKALATDHRVWGNNLGRQRFGKGRSKQRWEEKSDDAQTKNAENPEVGKSEAPGEHNCNNPEGGKSPKDQNEEHSGESVEKEAANIVRGKFHWVERKQL